MLGRAIRSELRKFTTTRLWWGMAIPLVVITALYAGGLALIATSGGGGGGEVGPSRDMPADNAMLILTAGIGVAYLLVLTVGIVLIGSEYRHKTITSTLLSSPRRAVVLASKAVTMAVAGVGYGLLFVLAAVAAGAGVLLAKGYHPFYEVGDVMRGLAMVLLVLPLWGLIGLGMGTLMRNQIAAIIVTVALAWIVEPVAGLLMALSPWDWAHEVARFLPSAATRATIGATITDAASGGGDPTGLSNALPWWGGALTLLGWAAIPMLIGLALTMRRDVS